MRSVDFQGGSGAYYPYQLHSIREVGGQTIEERRLSPVDDQEAHPDS